MLETTLPYKNSKQLVKKLGTTALKDVQLMNRARHFAGLSQIEIKVRRCLACGREFESVGERFCGCLSRHASKLCGHDCI